MHPISCTKSNTWSAHKDSPLFEIVLPSFWGAKSLNHKSRLRKRFFLSDTNTLKGQLYLSHHLHKVKHKGSPLSETVLLSLLVTKSLHQRSRLRKRYFGWHQPPERPALCLPSLVQSHTPDQRLKTVQYSKQFGYSCIFFRSFSWT